MKNIYIRLLILSLLGVLSFACSDEEKFEGKDSFLISFSLDKNEEIYEGVISGADIYVEADNNVDLEGAKANFKLAENATISPDPYEITDWNENAIFTVTSYKGTVSKYKYEVKRSLVSTKGTVILLTQKDVDEFAKSNTEVIEGDLIIGANSAKEEFDTIKNLQGLASLKRVSNNIVIKPTFGGDSFAGLDNLETAGNIYLGTSSESVETLDTVDISLPKLIKAGVVVFNGSKIRSVSMPELAEVYSLHIDSRIAESIELSDLKSAAGNVSIQSGQKNSSSTKNTILESLSLPKLQKVCGSLNIRNLVNLTELNLPEIQEVGADLNIEYLSVLTSLNLAKLEKTGGKIYLKNPDAMEEISLPAVTEIGSLEYTSYQKVLTSINMNSLQRVNGEFKMQKAVMEQISFPALESIAGKLDLSYMENVTELNVTKLKECKEIELNGLSELAVLDLSEVSKPESIEIISCYKLGLIKVKALNNVKLNGGSRECVLTQFEGTDSIEGELELTNYTKNPDIAFPGIKQIGTLIIGSGVSNGGTSVVMPDLETLGNLKIRSAGFLNTLSMPKLTEITDSWDTGFMSYIEEGDISVPLLRRIGTFKFHGGSGTWNAKNMKLTNLNDFSAVESIDKVHIEWWAGMNDYSGISNAVEGISEENWYVGGCAYNPTYEDICNDRWTE